MFFMCYGPFTFTYVCAPYVGPVSDEARREYQIPKNWSDRWL